MTENRIPNAAEDEDDVVGHRHYAADAEAGEDEDDVVGHVQPPRDLGR